MRAIRQFYYAHPELLILCTRNMPWTNFGFPTIYFFVARFMPIYKHNFLTSAFLQEIGWNVALC